MQKEPEVSKSKVAYLILSIIFFVLFAISAYTGLSLYFSTLGPVDNPNKAGFSQGANNLTNLGSIVIIAFSVLLFIITALFAHLFKKSEAKSKEVQ